MNARHIVIDTETLAVTPDAAIVAIAAVVVEVGGIVSRHQWLIEHQGAQLARARDPDTVAWWSQHWLSERGLT